MSAWKGAAPSLVRVGDFAEFVHEGYFDDANWEKNSCRPAAGGDEVLRRVGYRWGARGMPVTRVSWFEAAAFVKWWADASLPAWDDVVAWRAEVGVGIAEWCANWYNSQDTGLAARPEVPERRRVAGWRQSECACPTLVGMEFGFRAPSRKGRD